MKKKGKYMHIVVLGGGTGTFTLLTGLKQYPVDLTAIVAMADDGGSTGLLRDELGVLPPGDIRQCLVALSAEDNLMRQLMNYRFENGGLEGHSFGNLLLSALEKITGSMERAIEKAGEILRIEGEVIPATLDNVRLVAEAGGRMLYGEKMIDTADLTALTKIALQPHARANPKALSAIEGADVIVIGPGDVYTSLVQVLLIEGMARAIQQSHAKKVFVTNLVNKKGHTDNTTVTSLTALIEQYTGTPFTTVLYNTKKPDAVLVRKYRSEGALVRVDARLPKEKYVGRDLLRTGVSRSQKGDKVQRSFIRHDPAKLARAIIDVTTH